MALSALVGPGDMILRYENNVDPRAGTKEGYRWLPVEDTHANAQPGQVVEGPVVAVEAKRVTRTWTARNRTAEEIDAEKTAIVERAAIEIAGKVLFDHENRLRVLEGRPSVTANQFKTALKAML